MRTIILFTALFVNLKSYPSNTEQCFFKIEVKDIQKENISVTLHISDIEQEYCKSKLDTKKIPIKKIKKGKFLISKGTTLLGKLSTYSGMGPNGFVSDFYWEFEKNLSQ